MKWPFQDRSSQDRSRDRSRDGSDEEELDRAIDAMNRERRPRAVREARMAELLSVVRRLRSLRRPEQFGAAAGSLAEQRRRRVAVRLWPRLAGAAALAVVLAVGALAAPWPVTGPYGFMGRLFQRDIAYAMDRAVSHLGGYHGTMAVIQTTKDGQEWLIRKVEVWSFGDKYATQQDDGVVTVYNGDRRWQVRPQDRTVTLLPLVQAQATGRWDLRDQANQVMQYPHPEVGREEVAGRQAVHLRIEPPAGLPYDLWIDAETKLPLQIKTAMQNAIQTSWTFTSFDTMDRAGGQGGLPAIFTYKVPEGYKVVDKGSGQVVFTVNDAVALSGITPLLPTEGPDRIVASADTVILDYGDTTIAEKKAAGPFEPTAWAVLGKAAGGVLEVLRDTLRWQQGGLEITVQGARRLALGTELASDLTVPSTDGEDPSTQAQVKVPVDMEVVRNTQVQVDGGHSPWYLDPLQVAFTFVNLQISPGGIQGTPKLSYDALKVTQNNGIAAVVDIQSGGPTKRVYLKKLVRPDFSGIWSVVGYDPR